jgi:2-succinyl-6-hydroxy-2,4-cyclohexadiene-1-carboxylate synthase
VTALDLWAVLDQPGVDDWASMAHALDEALTRPLAEDDVRPAFLIAYSFGARLALSSATLPAVTSPFSGTCVVSCNPGFADADREARDDRRQSDHGWAQRILTMPETEIWRAWEAQPVFAGARHAPRGGALPAPRETLARALMRFSLAGQPDFRTRLRAWGGPLLWLTGTRDAKFSAIARELAESGIPATFVTCEDAGHRVPWDNPSAFARAVRSWMTRVLETPR